MATNKYARTNEAADMPVDEGGSSSAHDDIKQTLKILSEGLNGKLDAVMTENVTTRNLLSKMITDQAADTLVKVDKKLMSSARRTKHGGNKSEEA